MILWNLNLILCNIFIFKFVLVLINLCVIKLLLFVAKKSAGKNVLIINFD